MTASDTPRYRRLHSVRSDAERVSTDVPCRCTAHPNPYGLTRAELDAEIERCRARGWSEADLATRFGTRKPTA